MFLRRKKKNLYGESGIYVWKEKELTASQPLLICLIKGILLFCAVYGSLHVFLEGFSIDYAKEVVAIFFFLLAIIISLFYYNNLTKNIGYILLFALFLMGVFFFHSYINSGYSVLYNEIYDVMDEKYNFSAVNHLVEPMSNRYTSATLAIIFYGGFVFLVVNVLLAEKMSLIGTILCTFPFWQATLYFDKDYNTLDFVLILASYLAIGFIKAGGKYRHGNKRKKFLIKNKKRETQISYLAKGNILLQCIGVYVGIVIFIVGIFMFVFPKSLFSSPKSAILAKEKMDVHIQEFMLNGVMSRFNRYESRGGVSGGKLGGIGAVRPSYETDLEVTFVPLAYQDIYLKAYTGSIYTGSSWDVMDADTIEKYKKLRGYVESGKLANMEYMAREQSDSVTGKMQISVVNASRDYNYYPYYSNCFPGEDLEFSYYGDQVFQKNKLDKYEISYHPLDDFTLLQKSEELSAYEEYVWENYLTVTDDCKDAVSRFCSQAGVTGHSMKDIDKIIQYFHEQCSYSLTPGKTPEDKDFISYFLMEKQKGFCVHFASSAVMLFREMGIPARYIEGYNMSTNKIMDGVLQENEETKKWVTGNISKEELEKLGVISVEVSDAQAHAWVEIYFKEYGWIPIEVTPAGFGEEEEESSFWDLFQKYYKNREEEAVYNIERQIQIRLINNRGILITWITIGVVGAIHMIMEFWRKYDRTDLEYIFEVPEVEKQYWRFIRKLKKKKKLGPMERTLQEYQKLVKEYGLLENGENQYLHYLLGKILYGGYKPDEQEEEKAIKIVKKAIKRLKKE